MTENMMIWLLYFAFWASGLVFVWPMERRKDFGKKAGISAGIILIVFCISLYFLESHSPWVDTLVEHLFQIMMVLLMYYCWDISLSVALYNTIWAASLWQLLFEVWEVSLVIGAEAYAKSTILQITAMVLLFACSYVLCMNTIGKWMPSDRKKKMGPRQMISALMLFAIIEMLSYAPALRDINEYNTDWKFLYLSQMVCIVILYFQNELFKKSDMKQELELMNLLWTMEQEQYHLTKENIAIINQKSHDLKHHIRAMRKASKEEIDKYLDEMEDAVQIYETIVKTGNDVFDTILTEKSLYCKNRGIQVSCVADGSQMDFINTIDLYALLGNAMDNAIEAVEHFVEIEKRQIDVLIYRQQNFLVMNVINPIPEHLEYDGEFPITSKQDKRMHGFGLRSMRYIVKQYDGFLNISEEDGCFSLKILMPIPNERITQ